MRSGQLLSDEQRFLLNHLPNNSAFPIWNSADPEWPAVLIPRDAAFERLCAVAGAAHNSDARLNPASTLDWEFAVAVLKLNRHPMSWLWRWTSMKERRPWWDRWLLVAAALLVIIGFIALILIAGNDPWTRFQWGEAVEANHREVPTESRFPAHQPLTIVRLPFYQQGPMVG